MSTKSAPKNSRFIYVVSTLLLTISIAQAEPNAGQLLQQIEKERAAQLPDLPLPQIAAEPEELTPSKSINITVKSFQFSGNTLIESDVLATVLTSYLDRPLGFIELQKASQAIAEHYRNEGWVVRAYLPKQDVTEGIITIHIVEAVFGGVQFDGDLNRLSEKDLRERISSIQVEGENLNANDIDRALLLIDDLPGVSARGSLTKGQQESETNLLLTTTDEPLFQTNVGIDNMGPRSTGSERVTANLFINSPLKIGDQVSVNIIHSEGNDYGRLAYSLPVGNDGLRIGASGSHLSYDLVGDFSSLNALGSSSTVGLNASYPLIRSRLKNLYLGLNADHKNFDNEANENRTTHYKIDNLSLSLTGNLFDKLGGGGASNAGVIITQGNVDFGVIDLAEDTDLDGNFTKLNYNLSRHQVISNKLSAYVAISGQEASSDLDSAEKFYLGGSYGVRAYPVNEASGSDGQLLNVELRSRLSPNLILTGFYDLGHVSETDIANLTSYTLKGAGISSSYTTKSGLNLKATWARRIGDNPNPAANGDDQDGTLHKNRFWLQATTKF